MIAPDSPSLFQHPRFRRLVGWSAGWHVLLALLLTFSPGSLISQPPTPIYVEMLAAAPEPEPAPRRQQVQDAIVIPKEPQAKPKRSRPKPPEPEPEREPPKKQPTTEELMAKLRKKFEDEKREDQPVGQQGKLDPLKAAYQRKLEACMYSNMVGMQPFKHSKLEVVYDVRVQAGGALESVAKASASGERAVDEAAERAIQRCAPFPPPPGGETDVRLVFRPGDLT